MDYSLYGCLCILWGCSSKQRSPQGNICPFTPSKGPAPAMGLLASAPIILLVHIWEALYHTFQPDVGHMIWWRRPLPDSLLSQASPPSCSALSCLFTACCWDLLCSDGSVAQALPPILLGLQHICDTQSPWYECTASSKTHRIGLWMLLGFLGDISCTIRTMAFIVVTNKHTTLLWNSITYFWWIFKYRPKIFKCRHF